MDSPVLVIHGQVQVLQGGGVVFESGYQQGAAEHLVPVKSEHNLQ
jgi:hypothetical protein